VHHVWRRLNGVFGTDSIRSVLSAADVVPSADHTGAVEALELIAANGVRHDGTRGPLSASVAQRVAREALDRVGGKYEAAHPNSHLDRKDNDG
jgi:hypothetical protein